MQLSHVHGGGFWVFFPVYITVVGVFTWRILSLVRAQRIAEMILRERLARRTAGARMEQGIH